MFKLLAALLAFTLVTGCGSVSSPSTVHAAPPPAPTPAAPASIPPTCSWDGLSGACAATINHSWGYCQYETHQYGKSFSVQMEIGISSNQTNPADANCGLPLPNNGGLVTGISGTLNYLPWTTNVSSMAVRINANGDGCDCGENTLYAGKIAVHGAPASVPINNMFITPVPASVFFVLFNDDLAAAKPTTISVAFSGTLQ